MKAFWITVLCFVIAIGGFFVTSLCLANNNDRTLKEEWKSWFAVEETVETPEDEETEDVVIDEETAEEVAA